METPVSPSPSTACTCGGGGTCSQTTAAPPRKRGGSVLQILAGIGILLLPKCAMCWAAWLSIFGSMGISLAPYMTWLLPVLAALMAFFLLRLWRARHQNGYAPFLLSLAGTALILLSRMSLPGNSLWQYAGMALLLTGWGLPLLRSRFRPAALT